MTDHNTGVQISVMLAEVDAPTALAWWVGGGRSRLL